MAQAFDRDDNLLAETFGKDLKDVVEKALEMAPEAHKIIAKKLTVEERLDNIEARLKSLEWNNIRLR